MDAEFERKGNLSDTSQIKREFDMNKDGVIDLLIQRCMEVDVSIPRVVRGDYDEMEWAHSELIRSINYFQGDIK